MLKIREELKLALDKIDFMNIITDAGFVYSEDSNEKHRSPCFRKGGIKDRSEEKILLMNKGTASEFIFDLREDKGYDKFSFMLRYKDEFFNKYGAHPWGNDFSRMKDVVRNMTNSRTTDEIPQNRLNKEQISIAPSSKPFDPYRWFIKPLMESPKASAQQLYLMRDRGISKQTLLALNKDILAISDMLKFKAPNGKKTKEISDLLEKVVEIPNNKKEMTMSFIRSMDNIDTHFNLSYFNQNIIEPLKKIGISIEMLQPLIDFPKSCNIFEMNRTDDTTKQKELKIIAFREIISELLQKAGLQDINTKIEKYCSDFKYCFFETQLQKELINIESCLPEEYIDNTNKFIYQQIEELRNYTLVTDMDHAKAMNFISNIFIHNLQDNKRLQKEFNDAFKCLTPEKIYNFSPEYQPISKIRGNIVNAISALRQQPVLKTAAEIRNMVKNPMYRKINIAFAAKDLDRNGDIKGFEVKSINRAVKINVSGSDFANYFVTLGQQDPSKVKHVYVFESSIDSLSFIDLQNQKGKSINLDNTVLISCSGVPKSKHMSIIADKYSGASIHLCLDRDFAGKQASIAANCRLQDLSTAFAVTKKREDITSIPDSEKWNYDKYPKKGRIIDPQTGAVYYREIINEQYDLTVKGNIDDKPFNKTVSFLTDEISVQSFHERFPEVKKVVQYHIPTIAYTGQVGKIELGGKEVRIPTKDWNEMVTAPKTIEKMNREFVQNRINQREVQKESQDTAYKRKVV